MSSSHGVRWACIGPMLAAAAPAVALDLEEVWRTGGFEGPESAVYDAATDTLYVTNVAGGAADKDGRGFVSRMTLDGQLVEKAWVDGLEAPKGIALLDGKLYVADIDVVAVIDIASGAVQARHEAAGAEFLNDVSAAPDGRIFVTDMVTDAIWVIEDGALSLWLQDAALTNPNGVLAEDDRLLIGSWGRMAPDFSTEVPGHLLTVDYDTKTIAPLGSTEPVGNLDGVEPDGAGGYLVTDWMNGGVFHATADGATTQLLDLPQGSADQTVVLDRDLMILPMMLDDEVVAYRLVR